MNEVQVIGLLLSADMVNEPDILMVNGASAAMLISDIPWAGPVGCIRLGEIDGQFVVNPTHEQMLDSTLDLIYVGNEREMMMIEGSAEQIPGRQICRGSRICAKGNPENYRRAKGTGQTLRQTETRLPARSLHARKSCNVQRVCRRPSA